MKKDVQDFLVELIQYFSDQEDIWYICYDGTTEPNRVEHDPHFIMKSKASLEYTCQWLTEYLEQTEKIHYYELFKALVKETSGLWVNPTLNELEVLNANNKQDRNVFSENYIPYEQEWVVNAKKGLSDTLDKNGYSLIQGEELIERLVRAYDAYNRKDKSLIEWVAPIDISLIDNEADYILDQEVYLEPLRLSRDLLLEYENHKFSVSSSTLPLYFENVLVTKRGLESQEISKDKQMNFYFYQEITDYLDDNEYETVETASQKLFQESVNPSLPFVEIIIDDFTERYMNVQNLKTEQDILAFINRAYTAEGSDQEAKSFNRKKIIEKILAKNVQKHSNTNYPVEDKLNNTWDDINYSFR